MSEYPEHDPLALEEIEDILTAYADARLTPTSPVLSRMRAAVIDQAGGAAVPFGKVMTAGEPRRANPGRARTRGWAWPSFHSQRRAIAFGLATTLTLGTTAIVLAAPPGSPFYEARVVIENALLPTTADARLAAHEARVVDALGSVQAAAASHDPVALAAALDAYQNEVDAAVADLGDDADRVTHLEAALGKHVAVLQALQALQAKLPPQAAIQHAIDVSQKAVDKLKAKGSHSDAKPTHAPHPTHVRSTDGPDGPDGPDGKGGKGGQQ